MRLNLLAPIPTYKHYAGPCMPVAKLLAAAGKLLAAPSFEI
jgi:hypothetical protein